MHKLFFISLACFIFSFNVSSKEQIISVTDNDENHEIYNLVVNLDDFSDSLLGLYKDTYIDGKIISRLALDPKDLKTEEGMVLEKRKNYNVLNLKSDNFDFDRGGIIIIDTLYNGISKERKSFPLDLAKTKDGWKLFKKQTIVTKFHVRVNKVIVLGTVGIMTILME